VVINKNIADANREPQKVQFWSTAASITPEALKPVNPGERQSMSSCRTQVVSYAHTCTLKHSNTHTREHAHKNTHKQVNTHTHTNTRRQTRRHACNQL